MHDPNVRRRKWLTLGLDRYTRRKPRCRHCGGRFYTKVGREVRCFYHRNP